MRIIRNSLKRIAFGFIIISACYTWSQFVHDFVEKLSSKFQPQPHLCPIYEDLDCVALFNGKKEAIEKAKKWEIPSKNLITEQSILMHQSNCDYIRGFLQFPSETLSELERSFPLAYAYVVHKNFHQAIEVLRSVYWPQNLYSIHVDLGSSNVFFEAFKAISKCYENILIAEDRIEVIWGHPSVLDSGMISLRHLYSATKHPWKYVQILAGNDVPLRTNREMTEIFTIFNGSHDCELLEGQSYRFSYRHKLVNSSFFLDKPKLKQSSYPISEDESIWIFRNESALKEPIPGNLTVYKGSFAVSMSRPLVNFIFENKLAVDLYEWMKDTGRPQEQFWATLIHNEKIRAPGAFSGKCVKSSKNYLKSYISRYQVWPEDKPTGKICGGKHIRGSCLYGVKDLSVLKTRPELMAHKVEMTYQPATLYCLLESLCKRTYNTKNPLRDFQRRFYNNLPNVKHQNAPNPNKRPCG